MQSFYLAGLEPGQFSHLFQLTDDALADRGIRRVLANANTGFPCRVSLSDAQPGDELLLLPYEHHPVNSPYRASGPIYVRRGAARAVEPAGQVPPYVSTRLISLRAYDSQHMIVNAEVMQGTEVAQAIDRIFQGEQAAYIHLHNAKHGCFFCSVERSVSS